MIAAIYKLPIGPGHRLLNGTLSRRLAEGWEIIVSTVIQSGTPMSMPSNVYILGDPHYADANRDRMLKAGTVDTGGPVRNVLPGEQPVFQIRPPFTLRTAPPRFPQLARQAADDL